MSMSFGSDTTESLLGPIHVMDADCLILPVAHMSMSQTEGAWPCEGPR